MNYSRILILSATLLTLSVSLAQAAIRTPDTVTVSDLIKETRAEKNLKEMRLSAARVAEVAELLERTTTLSSSPESHQSKMEDVRAGINRMGEEMRDLEADRDALATWEQHAVDDLLPLLRTTALEADNAIRYANQEATRLWRPDNLGFAERIRRDSELMERILGDYLDYNKLREREFRAEQRISEDSK